LILFAKIISILQCKRRIDIGNKQGKR